MPPGDAAAAPPAGAADDAGRSPRNRGALPDGSAAPQAVRSARLPGPLRGLSLPSLPSLPPHVWRLIAVRGLRSLSQGYLNIVTPLYLLSLGLSPAGLGALVTASFLIGAALLIPVGLAADRFRRTPFLMAFSGLMAVWGLCYAGTRFLPLLLVVSAVAGIGRGGGAGGGQAGPFSPAEQALLADMVPPAERSRAFAWNSFVGAVMQALGAGLSGLPVWLRAAHAGVAVRGAAGLTGFMDSDRLLFLTTAVIGLVSLVMLLGLPEPVRRQRVHPRGRGRRLVSPGSARLIGRQALAGGLNAFGMSFVGPMFVVWMNLRFHVGADAIGPVFTVSYLLTALSFFPAARMGRRIGSVRAIVASRLMVVALTVGTALSPTFLVAAALQVMRSTAAQMITPVRQAFTMGLFPSNERASAAGMTGVARRLPAAVSPTLAGLLLNGGLLELPFFLGAALLLISAGLYHRFFAALDDRGGRVGPGSGGGGGARSAGLALPDGGALGDEAEPGQPGEPVEPLIDPFDDV